MTHPPRRPSVTPARRGGALQRRAVFPPQRFRLPEKQLPQPVDWNGVTAATTARGLHPPPENVLAAPDKTNPIGTLYTDTIVVKLWEGSRVRYQGAELKMSAGKYSAADDERLARARLDRRTLRQALDAFSATLNAVPATLIGPLFDDVDPDKLAHDTAQLEEVFGHELADLNLYYALKAEGGVEEVQDTLDRLNTHPLVECAYLAPMPYLPAGDIPPTTPLFGGQGYLDAAPAGIDALFASTVPGGRGSGIRVIDIEYGWTRDHEDFPSLFRERVTVNWFWRDHGTAVVGVLAAQENPYGIRGIVPEASIGIQSFTANPVINLPGAILQASATLTGGHVLLIELAYPGPNTFIWDLISGSQTGFLPVECTPAEFEAIQHATMRGVIVIEPAGNGSTNVDSQIPRDEMGRMKDSGAIMVGADTGGTGIPVSTSNFGSRVNLHGWGLMVMTLGYGAAVAGGPPDPRFRPGGDDERQFYTPGFNGTSSASAIVAGAAAAIQGMGLAAGRSLLSPPAMRELLIRTGTPQVSGPNIGPLPNLRAAIADQGFPSRQPSQWRTLGGLITSGPTVIRHADGRLDVLALGDNHRVWQITQLRPSSDAYSDWGPLPDMPGSLTVLGRVAVAATPDDRLEVFVRGDDDGLWHCWQMHPGGPWSSWERMSADCTSDPAVGINGDGRLEVFMRSRGGSILHTWQLWAGGGWNFFGPHSLGGSVQGSPAVGRDANDRLHLFARTDGGFLNFCHQVSAGGNWTGWIGFAAPAGTPTPAPYSTDPVIGHQGFNANRRIEILARSAQTGALITMVQTSPNGPWSFPSQIALSASLAAGARPGVVQDNAGILRVFARHADGSIVHTSRSTLTGVYTSWIQLGGVVTSDPAAGRNLDGRLEIFARGPDQALFHKAEPW